MRKTLLGTVIVAAAIGLAASAAPKKQPTVSFAEDVFPILQIRCGSCHAPGNDGFETSGLDLRSYEGLMKGTKFGPIVVAGDPTVSNLMVLLDGRADKSLQMPHGKKKLSICDRDMIRAWIREGALDN